MLSIIGRDNHAYTLDDTAAVLDQEAGAEVDVTPKYPWAIATPIRAGHVIRIRDPQTPGRGYAPGDRTSPGACRLTISPATG